MPTRKKFNIHLPLNFFRCHLMKYLPLAILLSISSVAQPIPTRDSYNIIGGIEAVYQVVVLLTL